MQASGLSAGLISALSTAAIIVTRVLGFPSLGYTLWRHIHDFGAGRDVAGTWQIDVQSDALRVTYAGRRHIIPLAQLKAVDLVLDRDADPLRGEEPAVLDLRYGRFKQIRVPSTARGFTHAQAALDKAGRLRTVRLGE